MSLPPTSGKKSLTAVAGKLGDGNFSSGDHSIGGPLAVAIFGGDWVYNMTRSQHNFHKSPYNFQGRQVENRVGGPQV